MGATTVALNLAAALAERGGRVVLVDADLNHANLSNLCQLRSACTVREILSGRRDIHEVLVRGPAGVLILPGAMSTAEPLDLSHTALRRVTAGVLGLSRHTDWILLDLGSGAGPPARTLLELAHGMLVVTADDDDSVMDSYAAIKMLATGDRPGWVGLCVNQTTDGVLAGDVYERISRSARNFLARRVEAAVNVPADPLVPQAAAQGQPVVLASPESPAAGALVKLTAAVQAALVSVQDGKPAAMTAAQ